jgi:hypothetical protein
MVKSQYRFSRTYSNWPLKNAPHVNIVGVESYGRDLDDMLCNATIYFEDWHGNEVEPVDLCLEDYIILESEIEAYLRGWIEHVVERDGMSMAKAQRELADERTGA